MVEEEVRAKVDKLQMEILNIYSTDQEHMSATLSMLCSTLGGMLAHVCSSESGLLDGIDLAHKHIRQTASDGFVKKQRLIKTGQYGR